MCACGRGARGAAAQPSRTAPASRRKQRFLMGILIGGIVRASGRRRADARPPRGSPGRIRRTRGPSYPSCNPGARVGFKQTGPSIERPDRPNPPGDPRRIPVSIRRPAWLWCIPLFLAASAVALHEDDPKLRSRRPALLGPSVRTTVAPGQPMATGGPQYGFPSSGVQLLSWVNLAAFGVPSNGNANVVWHYVSPSGTPYALVGLSTGIGVVRLTNPNSPEIVTVVPGPTSLWRDVR